MEVLQRQYQRNFLSLSESFGVILQISSMTDSADEIDKNGPNEPVSYHKLTLVQFIYHVLQCRNILLIFKK